jgi:23S rRNA pseudouridine1911/1915/1917 synthase
MDLTIIYEDKDLLVVDKPAGLVVFPEGEIMRPSFAKASEGGTKTLIDYLIEKYPEIKNAGPAPRYGIAHRLDKNTSGILLVAKNASTLTFLQEQFSRGAQGLNHEKTAPALEKMLEKKYITLVCGSVKNDHGIIHTLMGRSKSDPRKQTAHSLGYTGKSGLREAITEYTVLQRFTDYTLLEVAIKTGRKHQIRCHMAYLKYPVAGDSLYEFKDSPKIDGLTRQFLHASEITLPLPSGQIKKFQSHLPEDLEKILTNLGKI